MPIQKRSKIPIQKRSKEARCQYKKKQCSREAMWKRANTAIEMNKTWAIIYFW